MIGAGVTYTRIVREMAEVLPGLAIASRTVGSPQIRNRGTVGGNVATSSPAGDALPPLVASGAIVELESSRGARSVPLEAFCTGPKRNLMEVDELIRAVRVPAARGPQQFAKVGPRNAMVIAVCSLSVSLDARMRTVRAAIGSAAPTVVRAAEAEAFLEGVLDEGGHWEGRTPLPESAAARFGELVGAAARPIDDVRGSAAYRRHALEVLGRRTVTLVLGGVRRMRLTLSINGEVHEVDAIWEGESLMYVLRERVGLPGAKNACEQGECGSCSVLMDDVLVCSCLVLAAPGRGPRAADGRGPGRRRRAGVVQQAFIDTGAVQCGFCTPGLIMATEDLLRRSPSPGDAEIREALAGNLCRCTGYEKILDAVRLASARSAT